MKKRRLLIHLVALTAVSTALGATPAGAARLVDFGGDFVQRVSGVNRNLRGGTLLSADIAGVDDLGAPIALHASFFEYSLDEPLSPIPEIVDPTRYDYDAELPSATFYGGAVSLFADPASGVIPEAAAVVDHSWVGKTDADLDEIGLRGGNSQSEPNVQPLRHYAVFIWKKQDFLEGAASQRVFIEPSSRISLTVTRKWHGFDDARFLLLDSGTLYISEFSFEVPPELIRSYGILHPVEFVLDPTTTRWSVYEPSGFDLSFTAAEPPQYRVFDDVQGAGFYVAKNSLSAELTWITFSDFELDAAVSPAVVPSANAVGRLVLAVVLAALGTWWAGGRGPAVRRMGRIELLEGPTVPAIATERSASTEIDSPLSERLDDQSRLRLP